jgi:hypothetical protein
VVAFKIMLSAEQILNAQLSFWINDPSKLINKSRGKSKDEKLALREKYRNVVAIKRKIVEAFKPRPGETDVFVDAFLGERLAYPSCSTEQILTPTEIELLDLEGEEEDPVLEVLSEGYYAALELIANNG